VKFEPDKTRGLQIGAGLLVGLAALAALAMFILVAQPLGLLSLIPLLVLGLSLSLLVWVGWRVYGLVTARYKLDGDSLTVQWGRWRETIPLADIEDRHLATEFEGELSPRGPSWPGLVVSRVDHPVLGAVQFLATTAEKAGLVLLGYSGGWLALSPPDPAAFLEALRERQAALPAPVGAEIETAEPPEAPLGPPYEEIAAPAAVRFSLARLDPRAWPLWRDRLALGLIAAAGLATLALAVYLWVILPQLPAQIALRFDAQRQPVQFGAPEGLWLLAALAAAIWLLNTLLGALFHRRAEDRPLAYVLFGGTLFMAALAWGATIGILTAG
jgi:hypothetical protein